MIERVDKGARKAEILAAAEKTLSEKGIDQTSIADIAQLAGLPDSAIYQYFKGKEDLLFSVAGSRLNEALQLLAEQLEGIKDPVSLLRKMIWFGLRYNDAHRDYERLLIMECRCNINFYSHEAYDYIKKYANVLTGILQEGVSTGVFRIDINIRLVRDIIFGLLDWEKLSCLAMGEIGETVTDFQEMVSLIMPMIVPRSETEKIEQDKATRILEAATKLFSENGYTKTTIGQIARTANVADGTVYEYFKNKEDLLLSISRYYYKTHMERLPRLFKIQTPLKRLQYLIRYFFLMHLNERDFLKVFLFHIQFNQHFYDLPVSELFFQFVEVVTDILEEGKKDGSIRLEVNSRVFRNLFLGAFSHVSLRWILREKEVRIDKMKEVDEVSALLCRAVASQNEVLDRRGDEQINQVEWAKQNHYETGHA